MTSKRSKVQRPPEIDQAVKEFRALSRAELAKNEVVQFRMDTDDLKRLYQVCALKKKPVGTLVREWVLECTEYELATNDARKARRLEVEITELNCQLNWMKERFERLEATITQGRSKRGSKSA